MKAAELRTALITALVLKALRDQTRPISRERLAALAQCSPRQVRATVCELRRRGHLIMGDDGQYWIACDSGEIERYIATLKRKIVALQSAVSTMEAEAVKVGLAPSNCRDVPSERLYG